MRGYENLAKAYFNSKMEVLEFETPEEKKTKPNPVCPSKIIVLALARDHRGIKAKLLAEVSMFILAHVQSV